MNYLICTTEEYDNIKSSVESDSSIKKHSPIYNHDNSMVLVKGIGSMSADDVKQYQLDNNWHGEEL